ncbi:TolC family protein [Dyadobacter luticola]|uniref:TolC family protein n=1 Tax=Dyadobacter luticola TaxID=1979387 RepID=A0A5R9KYW3_9BACT|nr:TolC family protein [Dyadobacter luticola]TLV01371.1 TolC family protein [Dyadobacter luticola]
MNKYMNRCLFLILFCFQAQLFPAAAQVLSMESAVEATINHYPTLAAQRSALEAFRANVQVLRDNRLPNVRLHDQINLGTANGLSGSYFSMGLIVPTSGGRRPDNSMSLASGNIALATTDWEVYNFGRFHAENKLAEADIAVGESGLEREQFALRQVVINTYLDLVWLRQNLKIEQQNLARVDTVRRIINNLVQNGIRPGLDSSLASVELSRAKLSYYQMQEEYRRASVQLATLTGREIDDVQIDTTFNAALLMGEPAPSNVLASHPLLNYRNRLLTRQNAEIDMIRKSALPRISVLASVWGRGTSLDIDNNFGPIGQGFGYSRTNFLLGVAATVNLTDFKRVKTRAVQQQWRVREAGSLLTVEQVQLQNTLTMADSVMATIRLALDELPVTLRSATLAYQQRMSLYNNGIENILGITESLQLLTRVEKQVIDVQRRAVAVRLQKAYATSDFGPFFDLFRRQ